MRHLSDRAIRRLRTSAELPDLNGTRYILIGQVARGGMGVVYAAEDELLQRRVALKVFDVSGSESELANRLMREARVLARLEHPGIVPVHEVGTLADGRVFYTMKFVEGKRLDQYIGSVNSTPDRLRIFLRICDAVAFAHARGVLHRDLKPANVMVGPFGEVLVMDWGLAKILADATRYEPNRRGVDIPRFSADGSDGNSSGTGHGSVMGTPGYMSPEQARGETESLDARSDIFSLGTLLRYLLTDQLAERPVPKLDRSLDAICGKACAPERGRRYATVQDLAADVSRYLDGLAVSAHRESIFDKATRFYRRYRFFIWLIAAYLLMRVLLIVVVKH
ncbi:MAG TPA: serine/threonine-protein kinase [Terriglobales bacterium]|nr:serine/threonine-protein kinase [Terriglobales bacterium]